MKHLLLYSTVYFLIVCAGGCSKSHSSPQTQPPKQAIVTTIAGNGTAGFADGVGTAAQFNHPYGIVVDGSGNLYVGDIINNRIRKITPDGTVSTVAGGHNGVSGVDGEGSVATFFDPSGLALDPSGNILIMDATDQRVRKMTPGYIVSTIAGNMEGYLDATGTAAKFFSPENLTCDKSGNIFVGDEYNQRIRKITPAGVVTTFAGGGATGPGNGSALDGTGSSARFQTPDGLAFDASGNLYVADNGNNLIRKITPDGVVTTFAGSGTIGYQDGPAATAEFAAPTALAFDGAGNLFTVEYGNSCIREITKDGTVSTIAGTNFAGFKDGIGAAAAFDSPQGLAFDAAGNLYVADTYNNVIRKITFK